MSQEHAQPALMTTSSQPAAPPAPSPVTSLDDPRAIQILTTEHWSVLSARSLAYNEAFTRAGMFLAFLSTSFIGLALLAEALSFGGPFLSIAAIVLAFDFVIGLTTFGRIAGANSDDLRAMHGMARIRHGYTQIAPVTAPYFTMATHDDADSVAADYAAPEGGVEGVWYALTTSLGMIGLIVAMLGGVLACVIALSLGVAVEILVWIGLGTSAIIFLAMVAMVGRRILRDQAALEARFPAPGEVAD